MGGSLPREIAQVISQELTFKFLVKPRALLFDFAVRSEPPGKRKAQLAAASLASITLMLNAKNISHY